MSKKIFGIENPVPNFQGLFSAISRAVIGRFQFLDQFSNLQAIRIPKIYSLYGVAKIHVWR